MPDVLTALSTHAWRRPALSHSPLSLETPLPRRGLERLDLMLLCAEALDLNGGEAMVWMSEQLGYQSLFPNRVELWKRRCHNPLRRNSRRGQLQVQDTDALIRILTAMAERLYPMVRQLLSAAEPPAVNEQRWALFRSRLQDLIQERLNLRRVGVRKLLDRIEGPPLCHQLILSLALSAGTGGVERLKASLLDPEA